MCLSVIPHNRAMQYKKSHTRRIYERTIYSKAALIQLHGYIVPWLPWHIPSLGIVHVTNAMLIGSYCNAMGLSHWHFIQIELKFDIFLFPPKWFVFVFFGWIFEMWFLIPHNNYQWQQFFAKSINTQHAHQRHLHLLRSLLLFFYCVW